MKALSSAVAASTVPQGKRPGATLTATSSLVSVDTTPASTGVAHLVSAPREAVVATSWLRLGAGPLGVRQQGHLAVQVRGEPASLVQDPGDSDGPVRQGVKDRGVDQVLAGRVARRQRKGQHVHGTDAPGTPEAVLGRALDRPAV